MPCCYAVSDDLARKFEARFGPAAVSEVDGEFHLDLQSCIKATLITAGIDDDNIIYNTQCTCCHNERFFSYRKDAVTGRQAAIVTAL